MQTQVQPQLISFNKREFDSAVSRFEYIRVDAQKVIEKINSLQFEYQEGDLEKILRFPDDYLRDKTMASIPQKDMKVAGIKINERAFYDMIEKPIGYFELLKMVEKLKEKIEKKFKEDGREGNNVLSYFSCIYFNAQMNKFEIDPVYIARERENYSVYATTERSQLVYEFATTVCDAANITNLFNKLNLKLTTRITLNNFFEIFEFNSESNKMMININRIKDYDRNS